MLWSFFPLYYMLIGSCSSRALKIKETGLLFMHASNVACLHPFPKLMICSLVHKLPWNIDLQPNWTLSKSIELKVVSGTNYMVYPFVNQEYGVKPSVKRSRNKSGRLLVVTKSIGVRERKSSESSSHLPSFQEQSNNKTSFQEWNREKET